MVAEGSVGNGPRDKLCRNWAFSPRTHSTLTQSIIVRLQSSMSMTIFTALVLTNWLRNHYAALSLWVWEVTFTIARDPTCLRTQFDAVNLLVSEGQVASAIREVNLITVPRVILEKQYTLSCLITIDLATKSWEKLAFCAMSLWRLMSRCINIDISQVQH